MPNNNKRNILDSFISKTKVYLAIILILMIALCFYDIKFITPLAICYVLIVLYAYWTTNKRNTEISEHIKELTFTADTAAKNTLINSPFPLIIIETDGNVIWKSTKYTQEFKGKEIASHLNNLIREVKIDIENNQEDKKQITRDITIDDKTYRVLGEYVKSKQNEKKKQVEYMLMLYFLDMTKYVELLENYQGSQTCVGIMMVDNYEELMQRIPNEERPGIIAQIEKTIYDWSKDTQGLMIKSDRDTFVYVFDQKYLKQMEEEKFHILDAIKEIHMPEKIQATLSIAVSTEGDSNYEKYKSALASADIVLGRGGDQAVVRNNGKYQFFGGRAQEVEKRTKVKARIVSNALEELMTDAKNVLIMGHTNGDIDSMGGSMGIYRLARTLDKEAYIVNNTTGISLDSFMETAKKEKEYQDAIIDKSEALAKVSPDTLLIIVDTHKRNYVEVPELLEETSKIVVIDHHRRAADYIEEAMLTFHEVYASSASELVTELLQYSEKEIKLSELEAESLYAGIMVDTKNFTFKTGVRTFEAAAYLRRCGVDIIKVKKWFQSDLETYNKIAEIVNKTEIVNETIGISIYNEEDKDANIICAKAADELLTISDITASFVIGKLGDKVCISGRSIGDINVQVILEKLGGGGHITLAGAQVEGMDTNEVKQELINRINEYFSEISS